MRQTSQADTPFDRGQAGSEPAEPSAGRHSKARPLQTGLRIGSQLVRQAGTVQRMAVGHHERIHPFGVRMAHQRQMDRDIGSEAVAGVDEQNSDRHGLGKPRPKARNPHFRANPVSQSVIEQSVGRLTTPMGRIGVCLAERGVTCRWGVRRTAIRRAA